MEKLSTDKLRFIIGARAKILRETGSDWPDEDNEDYAQTVPTNPKNWKRISKSKISTKMREGYLCQSEPLNAENISNFIADELGQEAETVFDSREVTGDCIVRHFCYADFSCDCAVISDEKDENILRLIWNHC